MKYKHKKTGNIAIKESTNYNIIEYNYKIPSWMIELSDEWELIDEKDYEILSLRTTYNGASPGCIVPIKNGKIWGTYDLEYSIKNNFDHNKEIYSVKRLIDGQVFTIGDYVFEDITGKKSEWKIEEFSLKDTRCFTCGVNIICIKVGTKKIPVLKTLDNKEIYEGDYFWLFNPKTKSKWSAKCSARTEIQKGNKAFSNEKEIDNYITNYAEVLSIVDLNEAGCYLTLTQINQLSLLIHKKILNYNK